MTTPHMLGILFALASAVSWGTGDFSGGFATKSHNQFQVLFLMTIPGIIVLTLIAYAVGEPFSQGSDALWAVSAGLLGAFGIASLYRGLSMGNAAVVAPTAAVIGAGLPVAFSTLFIGLPGIWKTLGFLTAIAGIWCVSRPVDGKPHLSSKGFIHALIAGACFGGYFILIAQVEQGMIFAPLVYAKIASLLVAVLVIFFKREKLPALTASPVAILAGVFDAGGNAFYMLARQHVRLDVAAVLASMYPAVTVLLASLVTRENVGRSQLAGVVLCLAAIALISA